MARILIALAILLTPCIAFANAGIPMLFVIMPSLAWSIIPVIAIETIYIAKKINITNGQSAVVTSIANLLSTLIGVPLTWAGMIGLSILTGGGDGYNIGTPIGKLLSVTVGAAWLMPYKQQELNWLVPSAWIFLLVPFFLVSWLSESFIIRKLLMHMRKEDVSVACRNANMITYGLLAVWPIIYWFSGRVGL